jgi:hypothetical protein
MQEILQTQVVFDVQDFSMYAKLSHLHKASPSTQSFPTPTNRRLERNSAQHLRSRVQSKDLVDVELNACLQGNKIFRFASALSR